MTLKKNIKFLNIASELGAGTRGAAKSFESLHKAAVKKGSYIFENHEIISVKDENNSLLKNINFPNAKRIKSIFAVLNRVAKTVKEELIKNNFPILISGDHSISIGTLAGIKTAFPKKKIGVIWIDAHADIHTPFTTPSGNMHGMPIAASLNLNNKTLKSNKPQKEVIHFWDKIKQIGDISPKIKPEHIAYIGLRETEVEERETIKKLNIKTISVDYVRKKGEVQTAVSILKYLEESDLIYISFDVDVLDKSLSLGTGTPVSNGLFQKECESLIKELSKSRKLCCFEIVEINPTIDNKGNKMSEMSLEILHALIESLKIIF